MEKDDIMKQYGIDYTNFIRKTLNEIEKYLFLRIQLKLSKYTLNDLQTSNVTKTLKIIAVNNMNEYYFKLIRRDDEQLLSEFNNLTKPLNHSEICLLFLLMYWIKLSFIFVDRSRLKIDGTLDEYMHSYNEALNPFIKTMILALSLTMDHVCTGVDIQSCDASKPLFSIKKFDSY